MTKFEGLSIREAAQRSGVSQTAMKTRVSRAIRSLQRQLALEDEAVLQPASGGVPLARMDSR